MQFNYVIPYATQSCNIPMSWAVNYAGLDFWSSFQIKLMLVVPVKIEHIFSWCIFQVHCFASEVSWRQRLIYWMLIYIYISYIWYKWRPRICTLSKIPDKYGLSINAKLISVALKHKKVNFSQKIVFSVEHSTSRLSFRPINYSQVIISSVSQTSLILGQPYFPRYYPH